MSICIATLADSRKTIICVTDQKVSFSDFSAENMTPKNEPLIGSCLALCAGNDMQYAPLILEKARKNLSPLSSPHEAAAAVDDAYHEQMAELIEKKIFRRHGFTAETFASQGKKRCTESVYNRLCERIDRITLSARFLIAGFDSKEIGHVVTAGGEESVESFDHIGLWAIGRGAPSALSSLAFHVTQQHCIPPWGGLIDTLYFSLAAKFTAESADTVGQSTFVVILQNGQRPKFMSDAGVSRIKKAWLKEGAPRQSRTAMRLLPNLLYSATKSTDKASATKKVNAIIGKPGYLEKRLAKSSKPSSPETSELKADSIHSERSGESPPRISSFLLNGNDDLTPPPTLIRSPAKKNSLARTHPT